VHCVAFLFDFAVSLMRAPSKRGYFIGERGWLDLLSSSPSVGGAKAIGFLRLARLSRVATRTDHYAGLVAPPAQGAARIMPV
jgi:hypothetical protein